MRVGEITRLNISDMNFQERSLLTSYKMKTHQTVYIGARYLKDRLTLFAKSDMYWLCIDSTNLETELGSLTLPFWVVGREYCRPTNPKCDECYLNQFCMKKIELGKDL